MCTDHISLMNKENLMYAQSLKFARLYFMKKSTLEL
jgi:hypothetical protein